MGPKRIENLYYRFKDSPIYQETLREAYHNKLDLPALKEVIDGIRNNSINIVFKQVNEPSALAKHILEIY